VRALDEPVITFDGDDRFVVYGGSRQRTKSVVGVAVDG
jgi:hypothetical protein